MARGVLWLIAALWASVVVAGNVVLFVHAGTPGISARDVSLWPTDSRLTLASGTPTLVMFAHPKCACTRSSIAELARLMARLGPRVKAYVVFARPAGVPDDWMDTDLVERARAIEGVVAIADEVRGEAQRFGAETSGTTMLFTPDGRLRFSGGLTAARGHEGTSIGQERIVRLVESGVADRDEAAVFGCGLADAEPRLAARQEGGQ